MIGLEDERPLGWLKLLSLSSFTPPAIISFECFHDSTAPVGLKDETVRTATLVVLWTAGSHNASRSGCSGTGVQPLFWVNRD